MSNEKAPGAKLPPSYVRDALSRDVGVILASCIREFKEGGELDEKCFDVDAVICGRSLAPKIRYERKVSPISWSKGNTPEGSNRPLTLPGRGNFIPSTHFASRRMA
ncbi:MAG: hypothetical protein AAB892_01285 [Patescibacteria group bacterium]